MPGFPLRRQSLRGSPSPGRAWERGEVGLSAPDAKNNPCIFSRLRLYYFASGEIIAAQNRTLPPEGTYSIMSLAIGANGATAAVSAYSGMADEELLLDYRLRGDSLAFEELVHRHERELYGFLRRFLVDAAAAEDAFQATFLQVHLKCEQFDERRSFRPWLYAIATNQAIDVQRRGRRHRAARLDGHRVLADEPADIGSLLNVLRSREPAVGERLERHERHEWVERAIGELPEQLRATIILVYHQGLKYREAAEALAVPVGTVKSRLNAALQKLTEAWNQTELANHE